MYSPARRSHLFALLALAILAAGRAAEAFWLFGDEPMTEPGLSNGTAEVRTSDSEARPVRAVAHFDMAGVKGSFRFSQPSPGEPTKIDYDLQGLKGNTNLYHVHVKKLPAFEADQVRNNASAIAAICGDAGAGGHHNPHHVAFGVLPAKSAPQDKYETGDLSGKHGPLQALEGQPDRYAGSFLDSALPMSGPHSIVGRSMVIHQNGGKRWVCASIVPDS